MQRRQSVRQANNRALAELKKKPSTKRNTTKKTNKKNVAKPKTTIKKKIKAIAAKTKKATETKKATKTKKATTTKRTQKSVPKTTSKIIKDKITDAKGRPIELKVMTYYKSIGDYPNKPSFIAPHFFQKDSASGKDKLNNRKSPAWHAADMEIGSLSPGNNGYWWETVIDRNGRHFWKQTNLPIKK